MFNVIKSVSKHTIIYGLGDLLGRGLGFLMIPLYTHYLTPPEYGTLDLLDMTTFLVGLILAVGIAQAVVRFYYAYEDQESKDKVVSVALLTIWGISLVTLPLLLIYADWFSSLVFDSTDFSRPFMIIFVSMVVGLVNEVPRTLMRIKQQSTLYITISIVRMFVALTLNIVLIVIYEMGIYGILIGNLAAQLLVGAYMTYYVLKETKISWSFPILKEMVSYSFPLAWTWFAMFVLNYGDRFLLQKLAGLEEVGVYSLAYKFGMMANVLVLSPFMMTWSPKQFEIVNQPDAKETYATVFTYFSLILVFCSLGIAVLIDDAVAFMADAEYSEASLYVPVILIAYLAYGVFNYVQFGVHLKKKTKYLGFATLAVAVINVALNLVLIPKYSIWGATIATGVSFVLLPAIIYPISQRLYYIPYQFGRLVKIILTAVAIYYLTMLIPFDSIMLSVIGKFLIALSFPLLLHLTRFYTEQEQSKIAQIVQQSLAMITGRFRGSEK